MNKHGFPQKQFDELLQQLNRVIRDLAVVTSTARLLAENEPIGELVVLSLYDDAAEQCGLWARLKIISDWLRRTEETYAAQFPAGFPKANFRYDLTTLPPNYKKRFEIFKAIVENSESNDLWSTEIIEHDPLVVKKTRRPEIES